MEAKNKVKKHQKVYETLLRTYGPQGWWPLLFRRGTNGFDENGYHKGDHTCPRTDEEKW